MSWTKEERQMIRDGMSWGDVWMLRNPQYLLAAADRMIEESITKKLKRIDNEIKELKEKIQNLERIKEDLKNQKSPPERAFKEE